MDRRRFLTLLSDAGAGDITCEPLLDLIPAHSDSETGIFCSVKSLSQGNWITLPALQGGAPALLSEATRFTLEKDGSAYTMHLNPGSYRVEILLDYGGTSDFMFDASATLSDPDGNPASSVTIRNDYQAVVVVEPRTITIPGLRVTEGGVYSISAGTTATSIPEEPIAAVLRKFIFSREVSS